MCVGGRSVSCVHVYRKWYECVHVLSCDGTSVLHVFSVMVQVCACV